MPFELLSPFIEEAIDWIKGKNKNRKLYNRYLDACQGRTKALHQEWLPDGGYRLTTLDAFIPVQLRPNDKSRAETMSLKAALSDHHRLVVMGLAGAGKSTLAKYIAALLAGSFDDDMKTYHMDIRLKRELGLKPLFPIHIDLVACNEISLEDALFSRACNATDMEELVKNKLIDGGCFIIFDGLDEIIDSKRRSKVIREIADVSERYGDGNYFLVTTRPAGYNRRTALGSAGYRHYYLAEWTDSQQEQFVRRYYKLWSEKGLGNAPYEDWEDQAFDLISSIQGNTGLQRLKNNALMLSIITYLSFRGEVMPKQEYKVYETILRYLIGKKTQDDITYEKISQRLFFLSALAFYMMERKEHETISRHDLVEWLQKRNKNVDADLSIEMMEEKWGVLVNRNETFGDEPSYAFISQSFQIYLTAYAANQNHQFWKRLQRYLQKDYKTWEEVALMYASMSSPHEKILKVDQVIRTILDDTKAISYRDPADWVKAGRCLASAGTIGKKSNRYEEILEHLRQLSYGSQEVNIQSVEALSLIHPEGISFILKRILGHLYPDNTDSAIWDALQQMDNPDAIQQLRHVIIERLKEYSLKDRISLGKALALLGDDRVGRFVSLPLLSDGISLRIGMYPVTNVEYGNFIKETSYPAPSHWGGKEYPIEKANHPVTYVSAEDAFAYCQWMTENTQFYARLPTEKEWMYAAHSGNSSFRFPWESSRLGELFLNYREIVGDTTPVGIYCDGESPLGVSDLMGNVWEWTADKKGGKVVQKGGAWNTYDNELADGIEAVKLERPTQKANNIGFRILQEYKKEMAL